VQSIIPGNADGSLVLVVRPGAADAMGKRGTRRQGSAMNVPVTDVGVGRALPEAADVAKVGPGVTCGDAPTQ